MTFRTQILLGLTLVGLLPVVLMGWLSYRANRSELVETVGRAQVHAAEQVARYAEKQVLHTVETLRLSVAQIPFDQLTAEEAATVIQLPYRQLRAVSAVVLLDGAGEALTAPVFEPADTDEDPAALENDKPRMTAQDLGELAKRIPFEVALARGVALGPPYLPPSGGAPRLAMAVRVSDDPVRLLAAELSLAELASLVTELSANGNRAAFVDADGNVIAASPGLTLGASEQQFVSARLLLREKGAQLVETEDGAMLAAFAALPELRWGLVLLAPEAAALEPAHQVRRYSLFWAGVAVVLSGVLGLVLSRSLTRPVAELAGAVNRLAAGEEDAQAPATSRDELGQLAGAFNHMAQEIKRRNEEIRRWNDELQQRVNERTEELKAAEAQIERTRRMAAVASMGAGVAHELNNPMTSVIGLVSLVKEELGPDSPHHEALGTVLEQADRITQIVDALRRLTEKERERVGGRVSLAEAVQGNLEAHARRFADSKITVRTELDPDVPWVEGDPRQLDQLLTQLVSNAVDAMPGGGELTVALTNVEGAVKLQVRDSGRGIPRSLQERIFDPFFTTHQAANRVGLGLSLAHSIVALHHGRLLVESEEGKGATFTVLLPAAAAEAHLA